MDVSGVNCEDMEVDGGRKTEGARTETEMDVLRRRDLPRRALRDCVRHVEEKDEETNGAGRGERIAEAWATSDRIDVEIK